MVGGFRILTEEEIMFSITSTVCVFFTEQSRLPCFIWRSPHKKLYKHEVCMYLEQNESFRIKTSFAGQIGIFF